MRKKGVSAGDIRYYSLIGVVVAIMAILATVSIVSPNVLGEGNSITGYVAHSLDNRFSRADHMGVQNGKVVVNDDLIYAVGYYYREGKDSEWKAFHLDGETFGDRLEWLATTASYTLPNDMNNYESYVITYSCKRAGKSWHCHPPRATESMYGGWQLRQVGTGDAPTCDDDVQNQGEEGVDCGGPCSACQGTPTCSDNIKNGAETGVDCGGSCSPCGANPSCQDNIKNQGETAVDCGGPNCPACIPSANCFDGIKNQDEMGVDCGGAHCKSCAPAATCNDNKQNQDETGIDCGGSCPNACGSGTGSGELILYYPFDSQSGSTVQDQSNHNHNAQTEGNPTITNNAKIGKAMDFDGNDALDLGAFNIQGNELTIAAWIYVDDFNHNNLENPSSGDARIISKATGTNDNDHIWMLSTLTEGNTGNNIRFRVKTGSTSSPTTVLIGDDNLQEGQWYHVAGVYTGSRMRIYINGELDKYMSASGNIAQSSARVRVAANPRTSTGDRYFDGKIDELRIYEKALTQEQIKNLMGSSSTPTCDDKVMNQGEHGVDCGGPCDPCEAKPNCFDQTQNNGEDGVDCGGPCEKVCDASCSDGKQNGDETGTDCGGPDCKPCDPDCDDDEQNGDEDGVDCGGSCPNACTIDNWNCPQIHYDDANNHCDCGCGAPDPDCDGYGTTVGGEGGQYCDFCWQDGSQIDCPTAPPQENCSDGKQNQGEEWKDCGGPNCDDCTCELPMEPCTTGTDCCSGLDCVAGACMKCNASLTGTSCSDESGRPGTCAIYDDGSWYCDDSDEVVPPTTDNPYHRADCNVDSVSVGDACESADGSGELNGVCDTNGDCVNLGGTCDQGDDCPSGWCVAGTCQTKCTALTSGQACSTSDKTISQGTCAAFGSLWLCYTSNDIAYSGGKHRVTCSGASDGSPCAPAGGNFPTNTGKTCQEGECEGTDTPTLGKTGDSCDIGTECGSGLCVDNACADSCTGKGGKACSFGDAALATGTCALTPTGLYACLTALGTEHIAFHDGTYYFACANNEGADCAPVGGNFPQTPEMECESNECVLKNKVGNECTNAPALSSKLCIEGEIRLSCEGYEGKGCSKNIYGTWQDQGTCARDGAGWTCDTKETVVQNPSSKAILANDCSWYTAAHSGWPCDTVGGNFQTGKVCEKGACRTPTSTPTCTSANTGTACTAGGVSGTCAGGYLDDGETFTYECRTSGQLVQSVNNNRVYYYECGDTIGSTPIEGWPCMSEAGGTFSAGNKICIGTECKSPTPTKKQLYENCGNGGECASGICAGGVCTQICLNADTCGSGNVCVDDGNWALSPNGLCFENGAVPSGLVGEDCSFDHNDVLGAKAAVTSSRTCNLKQTPTTPQLVDCTSGSDCARDQWCIYDRGSRNGGYCRDSCDASHYAGVQCSDDIDTTPVEHSSNVCGSLGCRPNQTLTCTKAKEDQTCDQGTDCCDSKCVGLTCQADGCDSSNVGKGCSYDGSKVTTGTCAYDGSKYVCEQSEPVVKHPTTNLFLTGCTSQRTGWKCDSSPGGTFSADGECFMNGECYTGTTKKANGVTCSNGDECTNGWCVAGTCASSCTTSGATCSNDGNAPNARVCEGSVCKIPQLQHEGCAGHSECADSNECTTDKCIGFDRLADELGICANTPRINMDCNNGAGTCNSNAQCIPKPQLEECYSGDNCNYGEWCIAHEDSDDGGYCRNSCDATHYAGVKCVPFNQTTPHVDSSTMTCQSGGCKTTTCAYKKSATGSKTCGSASSSSSTDDTHLWTRYTITNTDCSTETKWESLECPSGICDETTDSCALLKKPDPDVEVDHECTIRSECNDNNDCTDDACRLDPFNGNYCVNTANTDSCTSGGYPGTCKDKVCVRNSVTITCYKDGDGDGQGKKVPDLTGDVATKTGPAPQYCDRGYVTNNNDCDDGDASVYLLAREDCSDRKDNNCNGLIDCKDIYCQKLDESGLCNNECFSDGGCLSLTGPCTIGRCDTDSYTGNTCYSQTKPQGTACKTSDNKDGTCDGTTCKANLILKNCYLDADDDGYGGTAVTKRISCRSDEVTRTGDCNDADREINPGATEICYDELDNNCNRAIDCQDIYCKRFDESAVCVDECTGDLGCSSLSGPCTIGRCDTSSYSGNKCYSEAKPAGTSCTIDGVAGKCSGSTCVKSTKTISCYVDADGDGYGYGSSQSITVDSDESCSDVGMSSRNDDCKPSDRSIHPGISETNCFDRIDNNCNGDIDCDDQFCKIKFDNECLSDCGTGSTITLCVNIAGTGMGTAHEGTRTTEFSGSNCEISYSYTITKTCPYGCSSGKCKSAPLQECDTGIYDCGSQGSLCIADSASSQGGYCRSSCSGFEGRDCSMAFTSLSSSNLNTKCVSGTCQVDCDDTISYVCGYCTDATRPTTCTQSASGDFRLRKVTDSCTGRSYFSSALECLGTCDPTTNICTKDGFQYLR